MRSTDRTTTAVVVAMFLAGFTLVPLTADLRYLGASWLFLVILGVLTAALRRARVGAVAVLAVQVGTGPGDGTISSRLASSRRCASVSVTAKMRIRRA